jgi:hypothetical protein
VREIENANTAKRPAQPFHRVQNPLNILRMLL